MGLRRTKISVVLLCVFFANACGGGSGGNSSENGRPSSNEYYIDATSGLDSNSGLSQATAWKTLSKITNSSFTTPSKIFLKRGETWNEPLILTSSNITLDAYGLGSSPKIDGSKTVSNWVDIGLGIYSDNTSINLGVGQGFGNLSENNIMMTFIPWDNDVSTTFSGSSTGSYSFDYLLNTLYIKPATNPSVSSYLASVELRGIYAKDLSNISIRNIDVSRISLSGIEFHNCVNCTVNGSTVTRVGGAVIGANFIPSPDFIHAGNGIDYSNSCSNGSVNNVTVSEIFDSCLAVELYRNNNHASNIQLANAQLSQCGFAGVEISVLSNQGINTSSSIDGLTVNLVNVDKAGKGWSGRRYGTEGHGLRIIADNGAGTMKNISVTSTQVSNSAGDGIKLAGEINTINLKRVRTTKNTGIGINIAEPSATTLQVNLNTSIIDQNSSYGLSYNAPFATGLNIYHNTFYANTAINLAIFNQSGMADIRNNLFYSPLVMTHFFSAATLVNPTINNNCYNDLINAFGYNGNAYSTVALFNAATSLENSGIGNQSIGLNNPSLDDFTLSNGSSCRSLGATDTGILSDYELNLYDNPPSSGAFEFIP